MKIITISREYAAGGHSIGKKVAQELGIEFYDKDIIRGTAKLIGIDEDQIAREEERLTTGDSILRTLVPTCSFNYRDSIFDYERKVIIELAQKGPCVILGRCSSAILQSEGIESLNVYLTADDEHRALRTGELIHSTNAGEILRTMKKNDNARRSYFNYYTGKHMADCSNYHLVLDTGVLGYETAAKLIAIAARN